MKKITTFLILTVLVMAFSIPQQERNTYNMPIDKETGKITYVEVVKEDGTTVELYDRAFLWAKKYFVNISSAIKTRDREAGLMSGTQRFKVQSTDKKGIKVDAGVISFEFTIEFKDGRYRFKATDFKQADNAGNSVEAWFDDTNEKAIPIHKEIFEQIDTETKALILSLKEGMKPVVEVNDEW